MDMDIGGSRPDRVQDIQICIAIESRMNPTLQANFGCPAFHRFRRAAADLIQIEAICRSAHVTGAAFGKSAKAATIEADVRVIDVAIDDIGHVVRSEEHTSELQSLMRISYAVF